MMAVSIGAQQAAVSEVDLVRWIGNAAREQADLVAVEEPLEIRLAGCSVAVTMRTPGHDFDLATGFLFTEGIIHGLTDIFTIIRCPSDDPESPANIVNVNPRDHALVDPDRWNRNFFATSSCGICGKASIDAIRQDAGPIESRSRLGHGTLYRLHETMRSFQTTFDRTGGLHAAALFDLEGWMIVLREDVGRHNAVDKVVGYAVRGDHLPLRDRVLLVSGRTSFEIVQKALMAGIPIVLGVSAPSSLAIELARSSGMTLVGFLREGKCNVYAGAERIV